MKLDSINGKGTGKKGSSVYYVNHGVQIEREYTSNVSNPQTEAQVAQRSRFKLISQVSAAVEPVIVIPRKGIQSPRNLFVKKNMGYVYADESGAQISYENLQITPGSNALPAITLSKSGLIGEEMLTFMLSAPCGTEVSRVIFCFFTKNAENRLAFVRSEILETPIPGNLYGASIEMNLFPEEQDIVCLAYGMKDKNEAASSIYQNYQVQSGTDIAKLVSLRRLDSSKFIFTQTRGATLYRGQSSSVTPGAGNALLYITCLDGGSVSVVIDGGNAIPITTGSVIVPFGSTVQMTANEPALRPNGDWGFLGWFNNGSQEPFSVASPLQFTMNGQRDIVADWKFTQYSQGLE